MRSVFHSKFLDHAMHFIVLPHDVLQHRAFLLDVVVRQCLPVFGLLSFEDQSPLVWMNAFLVYLCLHIVDGVAGLRHRT